ncbi:MAG TPA: hypothetical protein PK095_10530 [Myxococcota bacterium]|nr:hypothetical protein [Myxococcota bacterium]
MRRARPVSRLGLVLALGLTACEVNTDPPAREVVDVRDDDAVITTTTVTSLSELAGVERVRGHLVLEVTGAVRLPALTTIDGDLVLGTATTPASSDIILSALTRVGGSVRIAHTTGEGAIRMPRLTEVGAHLELSRGALTLDLPVLEHIGADLRITDTRLFGLALDALRTIGGSLVFTDNTLEPEVTLTTPRLESIARDLILSGEVQLAATRVLSLGGDLRGASLRGQIDLAGLRSIGTIHLIGGQLDTLNIAALRTISGDLTLESIDGLDLLDLPLLETLPGRLRVTELPSLTSIAAPLLTQLAELRLTHNPALTFIGMKRLARISGDLILLANGPLTFVLDGLTSVGRDLTIANNEAFDGQLPRLTDVARDLRVADQPAAYSSLVALQVVGGDLTFAALSGTDEYDDLRLATLKQVGGTLRVERLASIEKVALDELRSVGTATTLGDLVLTLNRHVSGLELPKLATVAGRIELTDNPRLPIEDLLALLEAITTTSSPVLCGNLGDEPCTE